VTFLDPGPILKAAQDAMKPSGPAIRSDDDIDRTIEAMIEFNKHMHSQIVEEESWKNDEAKRALVREGFKLSFPQFFEKMQPQVSLLLPQSYVFTKIEDLVKFIKAKL
jgi:hypothetical protein